MRRLVPFLVLVACSGDDSHKQPTIRPRVVASADAGAGDVAPSEAAPTALTEAMAAPYWTAGD